MPARQRKIGVQGNDALEVKRLEYLRDRAGRSRQAYLASQLFHVLARI
jgi:hypothetical protein